MSAMDDFKARMPARTHWPEMLPVPGIEYPGRLNAAVELLDANVRAGRGGRPVVRQKDGILTYAQLLDQVQAFSAALAEQGIGLGDRVLIRTPNIPEFFVAWFAVLRRGAIAVATMPLLRASELRSILGDSGARLAICHTPLAGELAKACVDFPGVKVIQTGPDFDAMTRHSDRAPAADTRADDIALLAYTSGTTGIPKGTIHTHRDLLAIADTYSRHVLRPTENDVFSGHPTLAFTFGLGGLLVFPMRVGASAVLLEQFTPQAMLETIRDCGVTIAFCTPTSWKMFLRDHPSDLKDYLKSLRIAVSAGETLPAPTCREWTLATGVPILDGIGATEMLHIFISNTLEDHRAGCTGKPVPGYQARVVDEHMRDAPAGVPGLLAVKGPTGCRYWQRPEAQASYVRGGWNFPGDVFTRDADGYFHYTCRADDMINCGGNNISGIEVENVLLKHDAVEQCAVVGSPDALKGFIPKAFIVLAKGFTPSDQLTQELQSFVKAEIAPYKYPRKIDYLDELPRTGTGKLKRSVLREQEMRQAEAGHIAD